VKKIIQSIFLALFAFVVPLGAQRVLIREGAADDRPTPMETHQSSKTSPVF
jgi:hypothetical protein